MCYGQGAGRVVGGLEHAHGAVPYDGAGLADDVAERLDGLGADVHAHESIGNVGARHDGWLVAGHGLEVEGAGGRVIAGQDDLAAGLAKQLLHFLDLIFFDPALAHGRAAGL